MCYNCGCGNPNDDMGNKDNITNATFDKAAKAENQDLKPAKEETLKLLKLELESSVK
jgi:hypothetical protein